MYTRGDALATLSVQGRVRNVSLEQAFLAGHRHNVRAPSEGFGRRRIPMTACIERPTMRPRAFRSMHGRDPISREFLIGDDVCDVAVEDADWAEMVLMNRLERFLGHDAQDTKCLTSASWSEYLRVVGDERGYHCGCMLRTIATLAVSSWQSSTRREPFNVCIGELNSESVGLARDGQRNGRRDARMHHPLLRQLSNRTVLPRGKLDRAPPEVRAALESSKRCGDSKDKAKSSLIRHTEHIVVVKISKKWLCARKSINGADCPVIPAGVPAWVRCRCLPGMEDPLCPVSHVAPYLPIAPSEPADPDVDRKVLIAMGSSAAQDDFRWIQGRFEVTKTLTQADMDKVFGAILHVFAFVCISIGR